MKTQEDLKKELMSLLLEKPEILDVLMERLTSDDIVDDDEQIPPTGLEPVSSP